MQILARTKYSTVQLTSTEQKQYYTIQMMQVWISWILVTLGNAIPQSKCKAINCPCTLHGTNISCINFEKLENLDNFKVPETIYSPNKTMFLNFGFHGQKSTFAAL